MCLVLYGIAYYKCTARRILVWALIFAQVETYTTCGPTVHHPYIIHIPRTGLKFCRTRVATFAVVLADRVGCPEG